MKKYKVEFALFKTVEIEAETVNEANDKAAIMEDEEIESGSDNGYMIWNDAVDR